MNPSNPAVKNAAWQFTGVVLFSVAVGMGTAAAETFQSGGSTTTIEQSGGPGTSHSQVIRDKDGQTIITRNGNSTDITVQRHSGAFSLDDGGESSATAADRFDRGCSKRHFWHRSPKRGSAHHCSASTTSSAREDFKQQMLERMHRPAP
jgi:hypothetical protein